MGRLRCGATKSELKVAKILISGETCGQPFQARSQPNGAFTKAFGCGTEQTWWTDLHIRSDIERDGTDKLVQTKRWFSGGGRCVCRSLNIL